jgi:hypothetical protein
MKILSFTILTTFLLSNSSIFYQGTPLSKKNIESFFASSDNLDYEFRKDTYKKPSEFYNDPYNAYPQSTVSKVSFKQREGLIRNPKGDRMLNKWGIMAPHFEKEHDKSVFRIIAIGGTNTAGWKMSDELTYPSILERMLNNRSSGKVHYQVINAGRWGYNSCNILKYLNKEIFDYKPDLLLLLSGGYNDTQLLSGYPYKNIEDYCHNTHKKTNAYIKENFNFFKTNVEKIAKVAESQNVPIAFIKHPFIFQEKTIINSLGFDKHNSIQKLSDNYSPWPWSDYRVLQKRALMIDRILEETAKKFSNAFLINHGLSIKSQGKFPYFAEGDLSPSGNRIVAYRTYLALNDMFNFNQKTSEKYQDKDFSENELEIQFIKSIFQANGIEDLSSEYCGIIHPRRCTHLTFRGANFQAITGSVSFVLSAMLNYPAQSINTENLKQLESILKKVIINAPYSSIHNWTLANLYRLTKNVELIKQAQTLEQKAYSLNPLLKTLSFQNLVADYSNRTNPNPFLKKRSLKFLLRFLKERPNYSHFYILMNELPTEFTTDFFYSLYFTKPIFARGIFKAAKNRLPKEAANEIERNWKLINHPYQS